MACVLCSGSERVQNAAGCGHAYCAGCVARELLRGRFACAVCKAPLSRAAFGQGGDGAAARGAAAAASSLAREMKARRRLAKILNRERGDYENDEAFYQYQEWAEDLAYRVVRGEDCERELADYKAANQAAIVARNQENEAREREAREAELREAAERAAAAAAREAAERREAAGRRKERERALSLVAQGQLGAAETARRVEAQVGKRRRRDEEQAQEQLEQQRAKAEPADRKPGALPRPLGAVPLMAAEQRSIGNSYAGQLPPAALQELYRRTQGASRGPAAALARARREAGLGAVPAAGKQPGK